MKYIIADPDDHNSCALKSILAANKAFVFRGSFTTVQAAEACIREEPVDIAFIRLDKAALNAFRLAGELRSQNRLAKVIFVGRQKEGAVEAFEYEADGFLLMPFDEKRIGQQIQQIIRKERTDELPDNRKE